MSLTPAENTSIELHLSSAVDKLAVRTAIASLELLKDASRQLNIEIQELTLLDLVQWAQSQKVESVQSR